jgi:hypothetical protein
MDVFCIIFPPGLLSSTQVTKVTARFCIIRLLEEFHLFNKAAILDGGFQWYLSVFVNLVIS